MLDQSELLPAAKRYLKPSKYPDLVLCCGEERCRHGAQVDKSGSNLPRTEPPRGRQSVDGPRDPPGFARFLKVRSLSSQLRKDARKLLVLAANYWVAVETFGRQVMHRPSLAWASGSSHSPQRNTHVLYLLSSLAATHRHTPMSIADVPYVAGPKPTNVQGSIQCSCNIPPPPRHFFCQILNTDEIYLLPPTTHVHTHIHTYHTYMFIRYLFTRVSTH